MSFVHDSSLFIDLPNKTLLQLFQKLFKQLEHVSHQVALIVRSVRRNSQKRRLSERAGMVLEWVTLCKFFLGCLPIQVIELLETMSTDFVEDTDQESFSGMVRDIVLLDLFPGSPAFAPLSGCVLETTCWVLRGEEEEPSRVAWTMRTMKALEEGVYGNLASFCGSLLVMKKLELSIAKNPNTIFFMCEKFFPGAKIKKGAMPEGEGEGEGEGEEAVDAKTCWRDLQALDYPKNTDWGLLADYQLYSISHPAMEKSVTCLCRKKVMKKLKIV